MWFVASQMASIGKEISLSQSMIAIFTMGVLGVVSAYFLGPILGYWHFLIVFIVSIFVIKRIFDFSFKQAFFTVLIYWIVMTIGTLILYSPAIFHSDNQKQHGRANGAVQICCNCAVLGSV